MALVDAEHVNEDLEVEIEILGDMRSARRITVLPFDPDGQQMRG
jgi:glycine cleavage system aminomethyltransferase T